MRLDALQALSSRVPALLILGEPGIGKTALLREAAKHHDGPSYHIGCQRIAREMRLDPLLALLAVLTRHPRATSRPGSEGEIIIAVRQALERGTKDAHVLVQFDDLQWADAASRTALAYLIERLVDFPISWQLAARTGYDETLEVTERLERSGLSETLTLGPLTQGEIVEILTQFGSTLDERGQRAIVERSGGNPLYAQLLAGTPSTQKPNVALLARDHVGDLGEALVTAAALAVTERPLDEITLGEIAEIAPAAVRRTLERLRERSVVETREGGVAIRHDLLAEAILATCAPETVQQLHLNAARIETGEKRARHLLAANQPTEARSVFVVLAWLALENEEWDDASRFFTEALAIGFPGSASEPLEERSSLRAAVALSRRITGFDRRGPLRDEEVREWTPLPFAVRARLELALLQGFFASSAPGAQMMSRFDSLIDRAIEPSIRAELMYQELRVARTYSTPDAVRMSLERLRALIPELTAPGARCRARARCAMYDCIYTDWDAGVRAFDQALREGAAAREFDAVFRVVDHASSLMHELGRYEDGLRWGRFALEMEGGSPFARAAASRSYATLLSSSGRPKEAFSVLTGAANVVSALSPRLRESAYAILISSATQLGLVERVRTLIAEVQTVGATGPFVQLAIGCFEELHGDPEAARAALEADFTSPMRAHPHNLRITLMILARIALRTHDERLLERTLERLRAIPSNSDVHDAYLNWAEAYGQLLAGNTEKALALLQAAKRAPMGKQDIATLQFEIGRLTKRREDLLEAIERFRDVSEDYMIDRVAAAAKDLRIPLRIGGERSSGAKVLTSREQTIALMISSGKTNAEIAAALSISKRTADHHVDHIRNKLGVRSRVEIAMAVAQGAAFQA